MKELQRQGNPQMLIALVGNKIDIQENRSVPLEEVEIYIKEMNLLYIETSAKLGTNVDQVFTEIGMNRPT